MASHVKPEPGDPKPDSTQIPPTPPPSPSPTPTPTPQPAKRPA